MQNHSSGPIAGSRQGAVCTVQTVPVDSASATTTFVSGTAKKLLTITASEQKPVYAEISLVVQTASDAAGTCTFSLGQTGSGYTDMLNAVDLKGTAGISYPARPTPSATPAAITGGEDPSEAEHNALRSTVDSIRSAVVASTEVVRRLFTADTDIYGVVTCSAYGAAGKAHVILKLQEVNVISVD